MADCIGFKRVTVLIDATIITVRELEMPTFKVSFVHKFKVLMKVRFVDTYKQ